MKTILRAVVMSLACSLGPLHAADQPEIEKLVAELKATPDSTATGIDQRGRDLAAKFQKAGPPAIPYLLSLLKDRNSSVRWLTAYILDDMPGLAERDLDALMESQEREDGWLPCAIARIGTPRAIAFLVEELIRVRRAENQLGAALQKLGPKAVPDLVAIYRNKDVRWDGDLERALNQVFHELGKNADGAVDPLLVLAGDERASKESRVRAIDALGAIGLSAERAVPLLKKMAGAEDRDIKHQCEVAILNIGTPDAVPILLRSLSETKEDHDKVLTIRSVAGLGPNGVAAGPDLMKYLTGDEWETRMAAARALGYIGYEGATDQLVNALNNEQDWRLIYSAAESLGRLHAREAIPALGRVERGYWYPPVRSKASEALRVIREGGFMKDGTSCGDNFALEFFSFLQDPGDKETLDYAETQSLGLPWEGPQDKPIPAEALQPNAARQIGSRRVVKVDHGYLVGRDGGEWGGSLTYYDERGASVVLPENIREIYLMKGGPLAVATRGYSEYGTLYQVRPDGKDGWAAKKWRELPGAANFSLLLRDGRLFVDCSEGLAVITPEGKMTAVTKAEAMTLLKK